ncbi:hypothetical protein FGLOB1_10136 [Fusarium globosum]|uniref:F-box domain-containing protein n=1 Tax=Fusarium globosum TaxID=78864 RepID=A0A8H5XX34_9HYPO|nr:hypothetical protein FGLOB1_10136 [Fusarium globosum]
MLIQRLHRLFCLQTRQYRNSSIIDVPLEPIVHDTHDKPNGEVCTSTEAPKIDIPDILDKPDDQDRTRRMVQSVIRQARSTLGEDMAEIMNEPDTHLLSLPDEILLLIIKSLYEGSDKPSLFAFFVLRQVSQRFRGLMRDGMFLSHVFSDRGCCGWCTGGFRGKWTRLKPARLDLHCFETKIKKAGMDIRGLGALIESERICKTCRPEFESRKRTGVSLDCKFAARTDQDWIYCSACEVEHPTLCFSSEEIRKQSDRVCIARTGYVRICAHEVLTWDEMKAGLGDTNDFWTKFTKICKHPSHKIHQVYPKDDLILPTALAERTRDYYYLTLSAGIHTKSYDEAYHQDDRMNDYIEYRNHMLPLGMMQMAREFDGSTTDDQYHRERNHSISRDTVGTMQSVQSRIRTLDVVVYQRPALILHVGITTLQGFLTGMMITGVAIYKALPITFECPGLIFIYPAHCVTSPEVNNPRIIILIYKNIPSFGITPYDALHM